MEEKTGQRTNCTDEAVHEINDQDELKGSANRSAQEYVDAVNLVIDLAEMAVELVPGVGVAAKAAKVVGKAVPFARKAAQFVPVVAPAAQKAANAAAEKAPDAVNEAAGKAARAAADLFKRASAPVVVAADAAGDYVQGKIDVRAQEKARREARRVLCDGAGIRMSAVTFLENWDADQKLHQSADGGYLDYNGCYAIATYASSVRKEDFGGYRDIYVGGSSNVGRSIFADLTGNGNVDVYADVKYKQAVYVLLFPCKEEQIEQLRASLITALDADASYNKD